MAWKLRVRVPGWEGDYDIPTQLTNREWHRIYQMSGVTLGTFNDEIVKLDPGLLVALAAIALERSEMPVDVDALWDAPGGSVLLALEANGGPPPEAQRTPSETPSSGSEDSESGGSSSPAGKPTSESSDSDPPPTGEPTSATSATSDPPTSSS